MYHAWYNVTRWKNSFGVCKGRINKAYGNDFRCSSILVVCYFRMGAKMQNADDGESESPYASHDTNATIKSYHAYLKATLRATKSQLFGRQVG